MEMKKLFIAATVIALAIGAQAASCSWKTGTLIKGSNADGSFASANAAANTLTMYVWLVDETTYNSTGLDAIAALDKADATSKTGGGASGITVQTEVTNWTANQDNPVYALILTTYKSGDIEGYIANKAIGNVNGSGTGGTVSNLAKNLGGGSGTAITGWTTAAVPEPTSGILMLVGLGALALRRHRE